MLNDLYKFLSSCACIGFIIWLFCQCNKSYTPADTEATLKLQRDREQEKARRIEHCRVTGEPFYPPFSLTAKLIGVAIVGAIIWALIASSQIPEKPYRDTSDDPWRDAPTGNSGGRGGADY